MRDAGSEVILIGPYAAGDPGTDGIDSPEELAQVPEAFTGYLWTNRIEEIGPLVKQRDN
jgi:glycerophosphoryl diester phosphodiesterase